MDKVLKFCLIVVVFVFITPVLDYIPTLLSGEPYTYSLSNLIISIVVAVVVTGYEMFFRKSNKQQ
ncbi:MAG: hypothetical protein IJI66_14515 [Erysipelotrichaceae bacterium]|nr:hypothetical protein [Erysipelotrichaceae bacterium]